ncbi:MAG: osmotically inducible protein OsmC [Candidatus Marinimicrobia bacterium]|nr:osmotically inducible protein OsmC [Candidatus Neomarinimicrobiota bacterium]|tara:strand:+ start:5660 stop:6109 length:450 start_codon:yes stop_codon:yes gene_type:complete
MSKISIDLFWKLENGELTPGKYSNQHEIIFTKNTKIKGDSAPDWRGSELNTNPEQTLAASISSCHMMTFLALAAKMKWPVISYKDNAIATLGKNSKGLMSVIKIKLNPKIQFSGSFSVNDSEMRKMQDRAHRYCFISNSLSNEVKVLVN